MTTAAAPAFLTSPRARRVWLVVSLAWFAWLVSGIFPITPLEGDEQGVIHGASSLAAGDQRYWDMRYLYEIQPGSYVLISRLAQLTHWSVDHCFALLSAGGALLFAAGTVLLVQRLLRAPWPLVVLAVLLSQEIWAAAYYMNTTAVGGWLALLAVLLALRPLTPTRIVAVAVLLAVAGWIRVDCLLVSPAVAAMVWWRQRALRPFLREIVPTTLLALAVCALLFLSCKVNPLGLPAIYSTRSAEGWQRTFQMYFFITSGVVGGLSLVGVLLMAWQRLWSLLLVWLGGTALTFVIYGHSLGSDKYFYLATPFFILAAVFAAQDILRRWSGWTRGWRYAVAAVGAGLLLFDTVIGVLTSSPEYRLFIPRPQLATLASFKAGSKSVQVTVGAGELIFTNDGYRMRGGALFAPATWRLDKAELIRRLDDLAGLLRAPGDCSLFVSDWLGYELVLRILRQEGFAFTSVYDRGSGYPYAGVWQKDGKSVHLGFLAYSKSIYYDPARQTANPTGTRTYSVGTLGDHGPLGELADGLHWQLHSPDPYGYIRVHERR